MTGPEKLRKHIERAGLTQEEFAALVPVAGPTLSLWLSGHRRPDLTSAFLVEKATKGAVRATDWIVTERWDAA